MLSIFSQPHLCKCKVVRKLYLTRVGILLHDYDKVREDCRTEGVHQGMSPMRDHRIYGT